MFVLVMCFFEQMMVIMKFLSSLVMLEDMGAEIKCDKMK